MIKETPQSPQITQDSKQKDSKKNLDSKKYKNFIFIILFLPIPFLLSIAILLYLYDPLQVFHKPLWRDITFFDSGHYRQQAKGVIDYYDFDSIIIGSSFMFKSSESLADELLGGKWVNFSTGGMSITEKSTILKYALKNKEIKSVIMSIEWLNVTTKNADSIAYLYDNISINDIKLYFNGKFLMCAIMWSKDSNCVGGSKTYRNREFKKTPKSDANALQSASEWLKRNKGNDKILKVIRKILEYEKHPFTLKINAFDTAKIARYKAFLESNLLSLARENPNTKFYFILPPHTRLTYYFMDEVEDFYGWSEALKMLVNMADGLQNVKIFGFDDMDYADNLGNYYDLTHYNADMNDYEIESIASDTHILSRKNIDNYINIVKSKIQNYDLETLRNILVNEKILEK